MIENNLPALHVVIPLIAAGVCALFKKDVWPFRIACVALLCSFAAVVTMLTQVAGGDVISYFMGDWGRKDYYDAMTGVKDSAVVGIEYRIDMLNIIVLLLISFIGLVMLPYAKHSIEAEIPRQKRSLFYVMFLLCFAGMLGIVTTGDVFNIYVFIEITSLSTYTLIALGRDRRALTSSFEYLIMGTLGATFILIGIGLLYMMTGTLNLVDMSVRLEEVSHTNPVIAAFAFITLGLAMKIALFPVHIWLTNAYAYAPSFVSAFLSATATKVMIYVFIRLIYDVFGQDFSFAFMPLSEILITLAILGIVVGSVTAVYQQNVKRLLAFSSVAQLGYMTLALGLATETGLVATIVHLSNHALSKGLLFLCVGAVVLRVGGSRVDDFNGVAKQMPLTMAAFVLGGFSLIGMPLTAGFISKWYLLQALLEEGHIALVIVLLISSLLAIVYIWRVVEAAYFKERDAKAKKLTEAPLGMLISMAVLVCANIYFGVMTDFTLGFARDAASQLFHGGL